jgi:alanine-synthesizing transaminase
MFSVRSEFPDQQNALTLALTTRRAQGLPVLDLTASNPTQVDLALPQSALRAALVAGLDGAYEPNPLGLESARQAVAQHVAQLQVRGDTGFPSVPPEHILLTASTSEAYALLLTLLCNPGDCVLVPQPSYPLFGFLGQLNDVQMEPWPSEFADGWHVDVAALRAAITPETRAILAVSPNNPTGAVLSHAELALLAELCRAHELALIVDEVFADTLRQPLGEGVATVAGHDGCLTFSLGGLSKTCLMPHVKLAWTVVSGPPHQVIEALQRLETMADTYLSAATPIQRALPALLDLAPMIQTVLRERLEGNLRFLQHSVRDTALAVLPVAGGWSAVLRLPLPPGDLDWPLLLLENVGVLCHPGWFFDLPGDGWLVLSLLPAPPLFREGVRRIVGEVAAHAADS